MTATRAYLDWNATAPLLDAAREAMVAALSAPSNASSVHREGRQARRIVEDARRAVAALVGAGAHVVFTSGATEAANLLLTPDWRMGRSPLRFSKLYVCAADHPATLSGGRFARESVETLPVGRDGVLDLGALRSALAVHDREAGLPMVAVHAANNETGVVQPLAEVAAAVKAAGGFLIVDAVQAAGRIPLDLSTGCGDFLILSSHKMGGPQGAGAIVGVTDLAMPVPLLAGGGQEKGHRAGTENVAALGGFGAAARAAKAGPADAGRIAALRDGFEAAVVAEWPNAEIYGKDAPRLPNTLFFGLPGVKAETAQIAFDLAGIAVSAGSACSSGKVGPSHVLAAMGFGGDAGGIRVSIGASTGEAELRAFAAALGQLGARRVSGRAAA